MVEENEEKLIKKKKIVGDADIFEEIITGKKHVEEDIYEDDKKEVIKEQKEFERQMDEKSEQEEYLKEETEKNRHTDKTKTKTDSKKGEKEIAKETQNEETQKIENKEGEKATKEEIKKKILEKAQESAKSEEIHTTIKLKFLEDERENSVFIGMKRSTFNKYKYEGALYIGKIAEEEQKGKKVYLDSMNPHVVFVCGARGSGKSYVLGVIAEELALKNPNVGIIVIDPIGVFWSMRYPNKEEKEIKKLGEYALEPKGLKNVKVFVPEGIANQIPKSTYDACFAMQPSLLTTEDWCLTFGIERFSPTGLLLDKALKKVEKGYKQKDIYEEDDEENENNEVKGKPKKIKKEGKFIKGKGKNYSLDDLIECIETDEELNSREKGYKQDSIRALVSRFEAAKSWGIFSQKGTPLSELSREGQLTILDTSFLDDNVTALVIGILARRVLAARKISTRKEAAIQFKSMDVDKLLELEIPPTWLIIDEAHTLVPSGNELTPASNSIIEYVKQGRRPGCSLVLATQQPSAINTKVLSQLDIMISHKLVFDDDIKAIYKRMPTIVPSAYKRSSFIKTLPVGVALVGDRQEETSRCFIMSIRPRMSQHEGRDTETGAIGNRLSEKEIEEICINSALQEYRKEGKVNKKKLELLLETLNAKNKTNIKLDKILANLKKEGVEEIKEDESAGEPIEENKKEEIMKVGPENKDTVSSIDMIALPTRINEDKIRHIAESIRKKKVLGIIGEEEKIFSIDLKYIVVWKINYEMFETKKEFLNMVCFIDSITGEFIHFKDGKFVESNGFRYIYDLSEDEIKILKEIMKKDMITDEELLKNGYDEARMLKALKKLSDLKITEFAVEEKSKKKIFWLSDDIQLPPTEKAKLLSSLDNLPKERLEIVQKEKEVFSKDAVMKVIKKFWPSVIIKKVEEIYKPIWEINLESRNQKRRIMIDAITGQKL